MKRRDMFKPLEQAWQQRTPRERLLLAAGLLVLLLAALWQWGVAPAWRTWQQAPERQARLAETTRRMQQWQAEARQLQAPARPERNQLTRTLQSRIELLGEGAHLSTEGEQLRVQLQAATPSGLAQWLALAREQTMALPQQAELQRVDGPQPLWKGSLLLRLP